MVRASKGDAARGGWLGMRDEKKFRGGRLARTEERRGRRDESHSTRREQGGEGGEEVKVKAVCSCGSKLGGGTTTQYHPYCYLLNFNTKLIPFVVGGIVGTLQVPNGGYDLKCLRCT